jgi:hypothetical protein
MSNAKIIASEALKPHAALKTTFDFSPDLVYFYNRRCTVSNLRLVSVFFLLLLTIPVCCSDSFWAQATFVKGEVKVKPSGSNGTADLKLGAVLHKGDTVITSEGARASFLLSDGSIKVLQEKSTLVLSPKAESSSASLKAVADNLSKSLLSREGNNPMLKHLGGLRGGEKNIVLGPNKTRMAIGAVRLHWLSATGTTKYAVTLMGPGDLMFEQVTDKTYLDIPAEKLLPATTYYWEIRNAADKDSLNALGSGSFVTLEKKEADDVKALEGKLRSAVQESKADPAIQFLLYQVYREHGMNYDALLMLESILADDKGNTEVLRLRNDLCRELGVDERDSVLPDAK